MVMSMIDQYGLLAVFTLILLEYACFPLPSEIVLPFSGAVAAARGTSFLQVFLLSVAAGTIGALFCYFVGYYGGGALIGLLKRRFPNIREGLEASQKKHENAMCFSVCVGRLVPICRTYISFVAGASRQGLLSYLLPTVLGVSIWNLALVGIGYALGDHWNQVLEWYQQYKAIVLPLLLLFFGGIIVLKVKKLFKKPKEKQEVKP